MNQVEIIYCVGCRWMIRAAWYGQELLQTFEQQGLQVVLTPAVEEGGRFSILLNGHCIADRKADGGFPEIKSLKRDVRDLCWPQRDLSHTDRCQDGKC